MHVNSLLLKNARLLDAQYDYEQADVLINDGRIVAVGSECDGAEASRVYDLTGYTLMPGFFDAHLHLMMDDRIVSDDTFRKMVQEGVTAVRDLSALNDMSMHQVMGIVKEWNTIDHPLIYTSCKTIANDGGYGDRTPDGAHVGINVHTPEEAAAVVDQLVAVGANGIKIGIQAEREDDPGVIPQEIASAIGTRARENGVWLAAHVVKSCFMTQLFDAGVTEAAHVPGDPVPQEILDRMVRDGIILTPTVQIYDHLSRFLGPETIGNAIENVARFYRAGGTITVGTDTMPRPGTEDDYGMPMKELHYLARAGMSPRDIVIAATRNAARAAGAENEVGTISKGKIANIIAVKGELDDRMDVMQNVAFVVNKGVIVKSI